MYPAPRCLRSPLACLVLIVLASGCATPPPRATTSQAAPVVEQPRPSRPKSIVMGIGANLPSVNFSISSPLTGALEVMLLATSGLTFDDEYLQAKPHLAEAVPTVENGGWKVFPDGRMETTWRLRDGITWHDGTPMTSEDLMFSLRVVRDPETPPFYSSTLQQNIEDVRAVDPRTVSITWKQPFIQADRTFSADRVFPRHLLEQAYLTDKANFASLPFWTSEYVSNGPYKLRSWETGVRATFEAYDRYALGRPKID